MRVLILHCSRINMRLTVGSQDPGWLASRRRHFCSGSTGGLCVMVANLTIRSTFDSMQEAQCTIMMHTSVRAPVGDILDTQTQNSLFASCMRRSPSAGDTWTGRYTDTHGQTSRQANESIKHRNKFQFNGQHKTKKRLCTRSSNAYPVHC